MRYRDFLLSSLVILWALSPLCGWSWGPQGHGVIGNTALSQLSPLAGAEVRSILAHGPGNTPEDALDQACNWPDHVRDSAKWEWTAPLHYVNIPRTARHYQRDRDCRDGLCVTAGIVRYANELSLAGLDGERRWQALAFLCHFVGDLHQPLHAAYKDDRGANRVDVRYRGETVNLHQFWDSTLIRAYYQGNADWKRPLTDRRWNHARMVWNPDEAMAWTDESHFLAALYAYPPDRDIDEAFAQRSWLIAREQWQKAAQRLATILNAVLGGGEVQIDE